MNTYQAQGRAAYKAGEYNKAIEHFDRAIARANEVGLLDNRAACHDKLGDFPAALKDAKAAIQLRKEDPTGYIRAGRVLIKMKKESVALEIYNYGLKRVKHFGRGYDLLRQGQNELIDLLSPSNGKDPLSVLPRELAELVFQHLSFRQLINASSVSKQWTRFVRSTPSLWSHLDLSSARQRVRNTFISRAINVARDKLTSATLNNLHDFDKALAALVRHCQLKEIKFDHTGLQSLGLAAALRPCSTLETISFTPGSFVSSVAVPELLKACQRLKLLEIACCDGNLIPLEDVTHPILCALRVTMVARYGLVEIIGDVSKYLPNLTELKVIDMCAASTLSMSISKLHNMTSLRDLHLNLHSRIMKELRLPSSIIRLTLTCNTSRGTSDFWNDGARGPRFFLPHLQELTLNLAGLSISMELSALLNTIAQDDNIEGPVPNVSNLTSLALPETSYTSTSSGRYSIILNNPRLKSLTHLGLADVQSLDDTGIEDVASVLPQLKSLDVSTTQVTGVGIKTMVELGNLEELDISSCHRMSSDVADWARSRGIRVQNRVPRHNVTGTKVRY